MRRFLYHVTAILILFYLVLAGCSESKNADRPKESAKTSTEQAADAIEQYGRKPVEKARATQRMGDERTDAIDEAVKQK